LGEDGKLKEASQQYGLSYLLKQCANFKEEKSDLEHLATELSGRNATIMILFIPKYHCELAGEGIEYCWGAAKRIYRKLPLKDRRSWESFRKSVVACLSKVRSLCADDFWGRRQAKCLVIATKPWKRKTEEKKSRVLREMKRYKKSTDPTGMHLPFVVTFLTGDERVHQC
jgi:hypothetical protein